MKKSKSSIIDSLVEIYKGGTFAQECNGHGMYGFARDHNHHFSKITWKIGGKKEPTPEKLLASLRTEIERRFDNEWDFNNRVTSFYINENSRSMEAAFDHIKGILLDKSTEEELEKNSEWPKLNQLFQRVKELRELDLESEIIEQEGV